MSRAKQAILPAYLLLCLLLGGSSQAVWGNAVLQLGAIAILVWVALTREPQAVTRPGRLLLAIVSLLALLFVVQLLPLPPAVWLAIPGRDFLAGGYAMLGMPSPSHPISLSPYDTMSTALTLLPPLALLCGMLRLQSWNTGWMFAAIVAGAAISIILGTLQVTSGDDSWYFYRHTNVGVAVGTFANGNHFATLLLVATPLLGALATGRWRAESKRSQHAVTGALVAAAIAVLLIGLLINGSATILLLGPAAAAATLLLALRFSPRRLRQGLAALGVLLAVTTGVLVFAGKDLPGWRTEASIDTRSEFWAKSLRVAKDHALTGTGFGTFEQVYRRYEDPGAVNRWYVNHAHNDFLEIAIEGGIAAVLLLVLLLLWWIWRAREAWLSPASTVEQKAATVSSAVIILHSAFDFPLRMAAIAAALAVCLAIMAGARGATVSKRADEPDPVRHAIL